MSTSASSARIAKLFLGMLLVLAFIGVSTTWMNSIFFEMEKKDSSNIAEVRSQAPNDRGSDPEAVSQTLSIHNGNVEEVSERKDLSDKFPLAVIHNRRLEWRKKIFLDQHAEMDPYFISWFSDDSPEISNCSFAMSLYNRCPTKTEYAHQRRHASAWRWISSFSNKYALVLEDNTFVNSSFSQVQEAVATIRSNNYDIMSLHSYPSHKIGESDVLEEAGLSLMSECIHSSSAYIISSKTAALLSQYAGDPTGSVLDHMCFLIQQHSLKAGHLHGAALVKRRDDHNVVLSNGWLKVQASGFHCPPPDHDPARLATVYVAAYVLDAYPPVSNATVAYRVLVNVEPYKMVARRPEVAAADAIFSHIEHLPAKPWRRLTYVLGSGPQLRDPGPPWANRSDVLAYWISNCAAPRMALLHEISRHAPTTAAGPCAANNSIAARGQPVLGCARGQHDSLGYNAEKYCALRRSKFALALESTRAPGYMTEKLWLPLLAGAVPLYLGAPDVKAWLPSPDAVIDLGDFPSVADAMAYVNRAGRDRALWERHTAWRRGPLGLRFLHALRNGLPSLFCSMDLAQLL